MLRTLTPQTIAAALGGLATGYVLWLLAISNGDNATVGQWGPLGRLPRRRCRCFPCC